MTSLSPAPITEPVSLGTRSGLTLTVRPVASGDAALLAGLFEQVSPEDRRFRFLSASDHIGAAQVEAMVNVDHWRTETVLAFVDGTLVATGMLACDVAMEVAEVAISLRSDHKARGIGWSLLNFLCGEAKRRGVKKVQSIESRENHLAIGVERDMGFVAHDVEGDPSVVLLEARF